MLLDLFVLLMLLQNITLFIPIFIYYKDEYGNIYSLLIIYFILLLFILVGIYLYHNINILDLILIYCLYILVSLTVFSGHPNI